MANEDITSIIKEQIKQFGDDLKVEQTGTVTEAGDGVARVQGLENVLSSEMVELSNGVFGMAMNLEEENVGIVLFGDSRLVKEGDVVMFPSYVIHQAPRNKGVDTKTIISWNSDADIRPGYEVQ